MPKLYGLSSCKRLRCQWPRVWPVNGILHCEWSRHSEWEWYVFVRLCVCVCARVCETARHFLLPAKPNGIKREIVHQFIIGRELIEGSTRNTFMRLTLIEWLSERGRERKREERTDDLLCGGHSCGCCCCCCCVSMETCCHLLLLPRINIKKATTAATSTATTITKGGVGLNQVVN